MTLDSNLGGGKFGPREVRDCLVQLETLGARDAKSQEDFDLGGGESSLGEVSVCLIIRWKKKIKAFKG